MTGCAEFSSSAHPQMNPESHHPVQRLYRTKPPATLSLLVSLSPPCLSPSPPVSSSFSLYSLTLSPLSCFLSFFLPFFLSLFLSFCLSLSLSFFQTLWFLQGWREGQSSRLASCARCSLNASLVTTQRWFSCCSSSVAGHFQRAVLSHFVETPGQTRRWVPRASHSECTLKLQTVLLQMICTPHSIFS